MTPAGPARRRFAVTLFGRRMAPWRSTRDEAQSDAVDLGLGHKEQWPGGRIYTDAGVTVVAR